MLKFNNVKASGKEKKIEKKNNS